MYCEFYRLMERPFNVTPDPKFLYLNARYREAIASLHYGITQRRGFITLIGEAGTGKTTLLKRLLDDLDEKTKSVFIFNTNVTFEEILEYIFAEFDLPVHNGKKLYMLQRLNTFLLEELRRGCNVALLIDEAQDLEFSVLEDLRLLSNLETAKEKILQIVLSGQPEFGQKLSNPILRQLRQRISINCRLLPLSRDEITEYIAFRLEAAGSPDLKLFTREAEDQIYHFSRGVPRLVNVVCDNALVIAYALGKKRIGADVVKEAAADLLSVQADDAPAITVREEPEPPSVPVLPAAPPERRWRPSASMVGLALVAVVVGLLSVGRTMLRGGSDAEDGLALAPLPLQVIRPGSQPGGTGIKSRDTADPQGAVQPGRDAPASAGIPGANGATIAGTKQSEQALLRGMEAEPIAVQEAEPAARLPMPETAAEAARGAAAAPGPAVSGGAGTQADAPEQDAPLAGAAETEAVAAVAVAGDVGREDTGARLAEPALPEVPEAHVVAPAVAPADDIENIADGEDGQVVIELAKAEAPRPALRTNDGTEKEREPLDRREQAPEADADIPVGDRQAGEFVLDGVGFRVAIVRPGDSVSAIAIEEYGQASPTILALLKLANPRVRDIDLIVIGQKIRLPELGEGFPVIHDGSGEYSLFVHSSYWESHAALLRDRLRDRGYNASVSRGSLGEGKTVYRVLVSGFRDREAVTETGLRLQRLFREEGAMARLAR
jgi:type II secretory pathway predicted ATPase ExeA